VPETVNVFPVVDVAFQQLTEDGIVLPVVIAAAVQAE
jgi:hypothetical protein